MRIKEILCTNSNGDSLLISKSSIYKPVEDLDTTGVKASITYATNYRVHGATMVSSRLEQRDLSLLFYLYVAGKSEDWIQKKRDQVFKVFNPIYNPITLQLKTETKDLRVDVNVETTPSIAPGFANSNRVWQKVLVQLSTGDPFFQETVMRKVEIATWVPMFEFQMELSEEGLEMGQRSPSLIVNVLNDGQVSTGMIIQFTALGTVENPSLFNVNTREYFKLNRTMLAGEVITVNTNQGKKRVESSLNGVTTNIFNYMEFGSKFMQLEVGDNLFRYDADSNLENLEVSIYFTPKYIGV
ncbi:phage tail family protein [Bacillus smithii]|uniref:phage tail family protein n=1 Tax=Bacillus smithii TaxID=1479 RepID=UPI002E1F27BD|nr:phage tail family protein [Bacillus smithii]